MATVTERWTQSRFQPGAATRPSYDVRPSQAEALLKTSAWLLSALALATLFAARTMAPVFGSENVVQDDARQLLFWMARFRDPQLFRDDLMADYFQAIAPPGYSALYRASSVVVDPLVASKLMPFLLGELTALFTFLLVRRLHPAPVCAFLATVLLSWYVWQYDDLASGTPRAYLMPLLISQMWALAHGWPLVGAAVAGLATLFYPSAGVLGLGLIATQLVHFRGWRPTLTKQRSTWMAVIAAALLVGLLLLHGQLAVGRFGPTILQDQARAMPEFGPNGRVSFFVEDPYYYWVGSPRSGLDLRNTDPWLPGVPVLLQLAALAALLPILMLFRGRLPQVQQLSRRSAILLNLLAVSLGLFLLAHLLLFRLYLPNRYVKFSLPIVLAIAGGLALGIVIEAVATRLKPPSRGKVVVALALTFGITLALYPVRYDGNFKPDNHPAITKYLRGLPKDILVAGMPPAIDIVPALTGRRVLTTRQGSMPFHIGYYGELQERNNALVQAYYAESLDEVLAFARRHGVDILLVKREQFDREAMIKGGGIPKLNWEPFTTAISAKLEGRGRFALLDAARRCAVLEEDGIAVVPTPCLENRQRG